LPDEPEDPNPEYPSHPAVQAVRDPGADRTWSDPEVEVVRLVGYFGESPRAGFRRLYFRLDTLSEFVEIREADILHHEEVPESDSQYYVWVGKDAMVTRGRIQAAGAEAYVEGDISLANLKKAVWCLATDDAQSKQVIRGWNETPPC
jgi:hypothetical protein